jgi:hypothetical protein
MSEPAPQQYKALLDRANALFDARDQDWVSRKIAGAITGLTPRQIEALADDEQLVRQHPAIPRGPRTYLKKSLLDYISKEPLTVLDAALHRAAESGTRVDRLTFQAETAAFLTREGLRTCWRLDTRDHLIDPMNDALRTWHHGDHHQALRLLQAQRPKLAAKHRTYRELGVTVRTLWAPSYPLTSYQRYRLHVHRLRAAAGFDTRVLDPRARSHLEYTRPLPALVVYPGQAVYLPRYSAWDRPDGATRVNDPALADALAVQLDTLYPTAASLYEFSRPYMEEGAA